MEITYKKYFKVPYLSIEAYVYYSFDNKNWNEINYAKDFIFNKTIFGVAGYLTAYHRGNDDILNELIQSGKRFNLKLGFKENGEGDPKDIIHFNNVRIVENGIECTDMNDAYSDVIRGFKFKAKKYKVMR